MVKKLLLVIILMLAFANIATAQQTDTVDDAVCADPFEHYVDAEDPLLTQTDDILARVTRPGRDLDGRFRGLGGENPKRNYATEEAEIMVDADGVVINEPDWGGGLGFFLHSPIRFTAPNGTWFISEPKASQHENLPEHAYIVVPGGEFCWNEDGGHAWAYAGATVDQIMIELETYFGPFTEEQLKKERARVVADLERFNSVLTLDVLDDNTDAAND